MVRACCRPHLAPWLRLFQKSKACVPPCESSLWVRVAHRQTRLQAARNGRTCRLRDGISCRAYYAEPIPEGLEARFSVGRPV